MNIIINNSHSHSPTKMVSWLLLPHLPDGGVLLNVFYTLTLTLKQHSFKNDKTQPQPHVLLTPIWICTFLNAYSPHSASHPHPVSEHFALWCIWKCLLFSASYHDVICNKYLPFQLCLSWKVLSPWRGDIPFFICTQPPLSLPPSLPRGEFLKSGAKM